MDRLTVDASLAAITAAILYFSEEKASWKLFILLAAAALTRETGFLLIAGYGEYFLWRRNIRAAAVFSLAALPALAWFAYVHTRTEPVPYTMSLIPLSAIVDAFLNPAFYPANTPLLAFVRLADYLALSGVLLAFVFAVRIFRSEPLNPASLFALLFAAMGVIIQRTDHWLGVYDYGRVYTPLLLSLSAIAASNRVIWPLIPLAATLPRVAIQLIPQISRVVRSL